MKAPEQKKTRGPQADLGTTLHSSMRATFPVALQMTSSGLFLGALLMAAAFAPTSYSQSSAVSIPPADVPLRTVVNPEPMQPEPAKYNLSVAWSEKAKEDLAVPLTNPGDDVLQVIGVQSSPGVFVTAFPKRVKAKGQEPIDFEYIAPEETDSETEYIRVLTNQGVVTLQVAVERTGNVTFDTRELKWSLNERPDTKVVRINVGSTGLVPAKAKVNGGGHAATIQKVDATTYDLKITPASTAKREKFVVVVDFGKKLIGRSSVVYGTVGE